MKDPIDELKAKQRSLRRASFMLYGLSAVFFVVAGACALSPAPALALAYGTCIGGLFLFGASWVYRQAQGFEQAILLVSETQPIERELELLGKKAQALVWEDKTTLKPTVVQTDNDIIFCPKGPEFPCKPPMTKATAAMIILASIAVFTCCVLQQLSSLRH